MQVLDGKLTSTRRRLGTFWPGHLPELGTEARGRFAQARDAFQALAEGSARFESDALAARTSGTGTGVALALNLAAKRFLPVVERAELVLTELKNERWIAERDLEQLGVPAVPDAAAAARHVEIRQAFAALSPADRLRAALEADSETAAALILAPVLVQEQLLPREALERLRTRHMPDGSEQLRETIALCTRGIDALSTAIGSARTAVDPHLQPSTMAV